MICCMMMIAWHGVKLQQQLALELQGIKLNAGAKPAANSMASTSRLDLKESTDLEDSKEAMNYTRH